MSVAPKISLSVLRSAIKRVHRLDGFAPPSEILKSFCMSLPFCDASDEYVIANQPIPLSETLGEIERSFYDVLQQHGPAMNLSALRDECLQRGMNANSFYQYITYSPIICRLLREVYALVGADAPPGTIEAIPQTSAKASVLIGYGWTDDGRIWISYRLNTSNIRNGVFTLPSTLNGLLSGHFSVQSSGTGSRTVISADGDRLNGLHRPIAIRGGQPDDLITVVFDIRHGNAEVGFVEQVERISPNFRIAIYDNSGATLPVLTQCLPDARLKKLDTVFDADDKDFEMLIEILRQHQTRLQLERPGAKLFSLYQEIKTLARALQSGERIHAVLGGGAWLAKSYVFHRDLPYPAIIDLCI